MNKKWEGFAELDLSENDIWSFAQDASGNWYHLPLSVIKEYQVESPSKAIENHFGETEDEQ